MPFQGQFAQYGPINRVLGSVAVTELLSRCRVYRSADAQESAKLIRADVTPSGWMPHYCIAVDGSFQEVPINSGYPGAHVAYVTLASVFIDIAKLEKLSQQRPVNPRIARDVEKASALELVFPGSNVILTEANSPEESFRKTLHDLFSRLPPREEATGESLLQTYEALLARKPLDDPGKGQKCPYSGCKKLDGTFDRGMSAYRCSCANAAKLYSTDALRIHEGMNPGGSNQQMVSEVLQVLERVWLVHVLRLIKLNGFAAAMKNLVFIMDGPLAVYGHPAWLSAAIQQELEDLNVYFKKFTDQDLLILGIEKSGQFAAHFDLLDMGPAGQKDQVEPQTAFLLTDDYIKKHIVFSDSNKDYGSQTYFGRKFFYKTKAGARIVATVPFLDKSHKNLSSADPILFPRLRDALSVLDVLQSSRYPNSVMPLIAAHEEAALPLNTGKKLLEQLAKELVGNKS